MANKRKKRNFDEPKPLNFDQDEKKSPGDPLKKTYMTPSDIRGDTEDFQYYEEEEAISPEEVKERKKHGNL